MRRYWGASIMCAALLAGAAPALAQANGAEIFAKTCAMCHTVQPGQNRVGPSLAGVYGRKAGKAPGFSYSPANKISNITWDDQTLSAFLADPQRAMPGTKMTYPGLQNAEDRQAVIDYLKAHSG